MSSSEKIGPGSYNEEIARLQKELARLDIVQELIDSVPEDEPDREKIQEILSFATSFNEDIDKRPIQRYFFKDSQTGTYYSKIVTCYTNSRWLTSEYKREVGMGLWNKAYQYSQEYFRRLMNSD